MKEIQPAHAKHSPSALKYKETCPGFEPRKEESVFSEEGRRLHEAVEKGNLDGLTDEQKQIVNMCREYVDSLESEVYGTGEHHLVVWREEKLFIASGLTFGTLDYALFNNRLGLADLVDFKFGRNSVPDAEDNPQIQAYVLGIFEASPGTMSVAAHILLPRRDEVSRHSYSRSDMGRLRLRISTIIARCEEASPQVCPTESCLYCARQGVCGALHSHALQIANGYDEELKLPEEFHPSRIIDPATMSRALNVSRVMEKWCDSVKHHALQMRLGGQEIPGYEMRSRAGTRRIADPMAAWLAVREKLSSEQFIACCDVSLSKLEETFAQAAPRGGKAKAKQELCEALADLGVVETGKESIYLAKTKK